VSSVCFDGKVRVRSNVTVAMHSPVWHHCDVLARRHVFEPHLVACVETRATSDVHATNVRHATTFDSEVGGEIWQSIRCAVLET